MPIIIRPTNLVGGDMSTFDSLTRTQIGARQHSELLGAAAPDPTTLVESFLREYVFAEVWSRPGLDRRARFLIAIAAATCSGASTETLTGYIRGALKLGELTLTELREAALHVAVYAGWARGIALDKAITAVANTLGLAPVEIAPLQSEPWESPRQFDAGSESFMKVMQFAAPPPATPFFGVGIVSFLFAELWTRPGLDQRGRRWITLACVADSATAKAISTHTHAAMASGDATLAEMQEFVLQYAIDGGWPKASAMQVAVLEMGGRVAEGLPCN